jgi:hypothetical protein
LEELRALWTLLKLGAPANTRFNVNVLLGELEPF